MNRINQLFEKKPGNILSVYFTAGHPSLESTAAIIEQLVENGVDLIEIGMPFSDPVADGTVIQQSSHTALENGMNLTRLFDQLADIRSKVNIPLILMGYLNPVFQYGIENFCEKCKEVGIDGTILPDLPFDVFEKNYKSIFDANGIENIFLITPQTSEARIRMIDEASNGFIYMVSSASTTGAKASIAQDQIGYFERIQAMELKNPRLIGFGISNKETFDRACQYSNGAIIGSAFVKALNDGNDNSDETIKSFISTIREN